MPCYRHGEANHTYCPCSRRCVRISGFTCNAPWLHHSTHPPAINNYLRQQHASGHSRRNPLLSSFRRQQDHAPNPLQDDLPHVAPNGETEDCSSGKWSCGPTKSYNSSKCCSKCYQQPLHDYWQPWDNGFDRYRSRKCSYHLPKRSPKFLLVECSPLQKKSRITGRCTVACFTCWHGSWDSCTLLQSTISTSFGIQPNARPFKGEVLLAKINQDSLSLHKDMLGVPMTKNASSMDIWVPAANCTTISTIWTDTDGPTHTFPLIVFQK